MYTGGGVLSSILLLCVLTGCNQKPVPKPDSTNLGGGSITPVTYVKVAYGDLDTYLAGKPETPVGGKPYYIEVTGLVKENLKGSSLEQASPLGEILKNNYKRKVALKLPDSVEGLENMTLCFAKCTSLVSVKNFPSGVKYMPACFYQCTNLKEVTGLPSTVEDMGGCFSKCTSLEQAPEIPSKVKYMKNCFGKCENLKRASNIPASVKIMDSCFAGCEELIQAPEFELPDAKLESMVNCFKDCKKLTHAPQIPELVYSGGFLSLPPSLSGCFSGCEELIEVPNIPLTTHTMEGCFKNCTKLTQVPPIPASVRNIINCFENCSQMTSITLKCNFILNVNDPFLGYFKPFKGAFLGCTGLAEKSITVPDDQLSKYKANAGLMGTEPDKFTPYRQVAYDDLDIFLAAASATEITYIEVTGLTKEHLTEGESSSNACLLGQKFQANSTKKIALKLPETVAGLTNMNYSFIACKSLISVENIPSGVKKMKSCFKDCHNLVKAPTLPANVDMIRFCFMNCKNLTQAPVIPSSVKNMRGCFKGCESLVMAPAIPSNYIGDLDGCFMGCKKLVQGPDIPGTVGPIGGCFENCEKLTEVKIFKPWMTWAFVGVFKSCTSLANGGIKVPSANYNDFTTNSARKAMNDGNTPIPLGKFSQF